jgi:TonB family protein
MNKFLILSLLASLLLHGVFFINFDKDLFHSKDVFSKKLGDPSIRIKISSVLQQKRTFPKRISEKNQKSKSRLKSVTQKSKNTQSNKSKEKSTQGNETLLNQYLSKVRSAIVQNKFKSSMATRLRLKGSVKLQFMIKTPSQVTGIKILEASRFKHLNNSAVQTIKTTTNIPPIPRDLNLLEIPLTLAIIYE